MPPHKPRGSTEQHSDQIDRVLSEAEGTVDTPDEPVTPDIKPDRTRQFANLSFSRMKLSWNPRELQLMQQIGSMADGALKDAFPGVYWFLDEELYPLTRIPVMKVDPMTDKEYQVRDTLNRPVWERNEHGHYIERWGRITDGDRSQLLYTISTNLIAWRQQAAMLWSEAMFAKGLWEEQFAHGYITPADKKLTIDDRTQMGRLASMDERYFAIFRSVISRRADALIKSMERIEEMLLKTVRS